MVSSRRDEPGAVVEVASGSIGRNNSPHPMPVISCTQGEAATQIRTVTAGAFIQHLHKIARRRRLDNDCGAYQPDERFLLPEILVSSSIILIARIAESP